jgi:AraC family transcriptional regulator of adaptative response/methylated-DNA-[protein]-cysteine methyltransferase
MTPEAHDLGSDSNRRFQAGSARTPSEAGAALEIKFAFAECSLGKLLVGASEKGVCAISFGDEPDVLLRDLRDKFPKARLIEVDAESERLLAQVVSFVEEPEIGPELPLDIRGTAFQQRVWAALRAIPLGSIVSYAEVAARIGEPKATRAVAGACAANKIALAIPCHRVVRSDGSLSGYHWGRERKRALLDREAKG